VEGVLSKDTATIDTYLLTLKLRVKKLALDVGAQDLIILFKYAITYSHYDATNKKTKSKTFLFFFLKTYEFC